MTLCARFGVSRVSVRRALAMLEAEGLVQRRHGVGTFVAASAGSGGPPRLGGLLDNLITLGLETTATLLAFEHEVRFPGFAAAALRMREDERGVRIERLRLFKGSPLSLTQIFLPPRLSELLTPAAMDERPVIRILEQAGLRAVSAEQVISAVVADDHAARHLDVPIGSPLIRLRKTVLDENGQAFEYQQGLYNPDRYEYYMLLTRDNNASRPQWRHIG